MKKFSNIMSNVILQIILAISGFAIPKFILTIYGSDINGMIASITQFLGYIALVEMGISNAAVVTLYKPLSENDNIAIGNVYATVKKMYVISGILYLALTILLTLLYPFAVGKQIDSSLTANMIVILSVAGAIDFFFLNKYKVLLIANQKYYIVNNAKSIATVVTLIGSILLLLSGQSVLIVKLLFVIIHILEVLYLIIYVRIKYIHINFKSKKGVLIKQRWNAMIHQICAVIVYNTDIAILSIFLPHGSLKEISVYSVYAMVHSFINNFVGVLTVGINVFFGNLFAKNDIERIYKQYNIYEYIYFIFLCICYVSFGVLIQPFVSWYSRNVVDVNYMRMNVGLLFALVGFSAQVKEVSMVIIRAVGQYKETQKYAISQAIINIIISVILVDKLGIVGVLIGTFISHLYMDIKIISYMGKKILSESFNTTVKRLLLNCVVSIILVFIELQLVTITSTWSAWFSQAIIIGIINTLIFLTINLFFDVNSFKCAVTELKKIIKARYKI